MFGNHLAHGGLLGDVGNAQQGVSIACLDFIDHGLTLFHRRTHIDSDGDARSGQAQCDLAADVAARPGD